MEARREGMHLGGVSFMGISHGMGRTRALSLLDHVGVAAVRNLLRQG